MIKNHEFNSISVADGTELDAYIAIPGSDGKVPGIILLQEAFGVNHHIESIAERLCTEGYAVVAPDLFHRTINRLVVPYTNFSEAIPHYQAITKEGLSFDFQAVYDWFQQQDIINKDKIGSIGFCLGGRASFLANARLPLAAGVSYYGGGLDQWTDEAENLYADHLFFWGGKDQHITAEVVETIINAVKKAGKEYTNVVFSSADHGFHCDERSSYHPLAAKEAWAHTLTFFESRLKN
ncbi:dienelactone hydrolase family protein [Lutibacter sp. B1]|uniref:dienelactone hydrolase family protein n=1 Tax=Lutibacter sp. B1 TaxID=2725996 RepID=UPI00145789C6|nr:dienelactone hydrolase family protein [Lutibacter sp. B1]NLP57289.1 dienelactone hydrolase family protein [Lutibacter sp. B1]